MKTFFSLSICLCGFCSIALAQKSPTVALDTIKEFYPDSTLSRVYTVQKGTDIREGASLSYHPNGKLAIEAPYKAGKLDGVFRSYYVNGKLWQTVGYKDGIEEGISTDYYEDGKKKSREVERQQRGVGRTWPDTPSLALRERPDSRQGPGVRRPRCAKGRDDFCAWAASRCLPTLPERRESAGSGIPDQPLRKELRLLVFLAGLNRVPHHVTDEEHARGE